MRDMLDSLSDSAHGEETSLDDIVEALGQASFVPVLLAPALAVVTPLSGIPLFSSFCGIFIALVAGQSLIGRSHLWLPGWLTRRAVPTKRLKKGIDQLRKPAAWIDRHSGERLTFLVTPPADRLIFLACLLCGMAMPLLEVVPFSSSILGAAVTLMAFTLLARDGLFALLALVVIAGGLTLAVRSI